MASGLRVGNPKPQFLVAARWIIELHTEFGWKDENLHLSAIPRVSISRQKVGLASLTSKQRIYLDLHIVCMTV